MIVLLPPKSASEKQSPKKSVPPKTVARHELIAMAGTIVCTALSVGILISRLLGSGG